MSPILAVAYREHRIRLSNPILPFWDVLVPVVYLVIFGSSFERWIGSEAFEVAYPTFLLGGILAMISFSIAMNTSYAFFEDLQSGIFHEMLTYPFARMDLLLGKLLYNALFAVMSALLCILTARLALDVPVTMAAVPMLVFWTVAGTAVWYFLLTWVSLKARGFNAYHTTTSAVYLLLMFISNLFYPTDRLPDAVRWLAWLNPVTWQVGLLRHATYGAGAGPAIRLEAVALILFLLGVFLPANRVLNSPIE
jgi:ABC-2 type transport system permease protein